MKPNFTFQEEGIEIVPYEKRKRQFVFVGRLDKLKGIDLLFDAWAMMGDAAPELVVCGSGPMGEWCKEFIAEHNISNIQMLGQVDNITAKDIMAHSLALIFPTQVYEGFPMTMVEAFSVGTPVIAPQMGNAGDLIEEGENGWKYSQDTQSFLFKIETVLSKHNEGSDIDISTYQIYERKYMLDKNYDRLITIYYSLMGAAK